MESTFTNTSRDDSSRIADLSCTSHVLGVFYAKSLATRPLISRVDFYPDESWRLESTRNESPTFLALPHILGVFYAKSLATRLPISRVDFCQDESWRLESSRRLFLPYLISFVYLTLSPSPLELQFVESTFTQTSRDESSRLEPSRRLFLPYLISYMKRRSWKLASCPTTLALPKSILWLFSWTWQEIFKRLDIQVFSDKDYKP